MKTIKHGERATFGLFKREGDSQFIYAMLPLFPWYGRVWQIVDDSHVTGWHLKFVIARFAIGDLTVRKDFVEESEMWPWK